MANDKKRPDDLIDALGQIDERFIHEAENVTPFTFAGLRRKKRRLIPVLLAAALPCVLLLAGLGMMLNTSKSAREPGGASTSGAISTSDSSMMPEESEGRNPLEIRLLSLTEKQLDPHFVDPNALFLDGKCRLVWSYGDGSYYGVNVTDSADLRRLGEYLTDPAAIVPAEEVEDNGLRFWICTGDGVSATPYLLYGAWGVGNLFDYNPESLPSSDFASFLSDLILKYLA